MADSKKAVTRVDKEAARLAREKASVDFERLVARRLRFVLPLAAIVIAVSAFFVKGLAFALLVLTAGALLYAIFELWWSLRTLAGDAPIETGFLAESLASNVAALEEQKRAVLRTLKDLDHEKAIGRLTEEDYQELADTYRAEAKDVLRKLDAIAGKDAGAMEEAERLVENRLEKISRATSPDNSDVYFAQDLSEKVAAAKRKSEAKEAAAKKVDEGDAESEDTKGELPLSESEQRSAKTTRTCISCAAVNDVDAAFCKKCGKPIGGASVE